MVFDELIEKVANRIIAHMARLILAVLKLLAKIRKRSR